MKLLKSLGLPLAVITCCSAGPADKPTAESIDKLMHVMKITDMTTGIQKQIRGMMDQMYSDPTIVGELTPEKKVAIAKVEDKILAEMNGFLSWDNLKDPTVSTYQESFTQKEVDSMIAFYSTPEGASIVNKLPQVMQISMMKMQGKIRPMMQRMMAIAKESADQLKAGNLAVVPENLTPGSKSGT